MSYRMHAVRRVRRLRRMRTLACLLKQPSETFQAYNARLLDACRVLRPTAARMVVVADQPKVDLLATDDEAAVVRVAVCPLSADDDGEAVTLALENAHPNRLAHWRGHEPRSAHGSAFGLAVLTHCALALSAKDLTSLQPCESRP